MRTSASLSFVFLATLASASVAPAQTVPQQLTLEEAIRIARENNPDYLKLLNDMDVQDMNVRSSWAAFLPSLSGGFNFGGSYNETLTTLNEFNDPVRLEEPLTRRSSNANQSLGLNMSLFDGGRSIGNLRAARAMRDATTFQLALQAHELDMNVTTDYHAVARADRLIALEEQLLAAAKENLERLRRLLSLASSKYVDVLSAEVNVADAERSLNIARANAQKARLALLERLGVSGPANVSLSTEAPAIFDPAQINADELVNRAITSSPMVRSAEAQLFAQSRRVSVAKGGRLPTISASAGVGRGVSGPGYGYFGEFNPDANRSFNFNVNISVPIFNRFETSSQIAAASAAEADAREDIRKQKLAVERGVRTALIDLGNAYSGVQLAQRKVDLSREQLAAAEEEYRLGSMTFIILQQIINSAANAERQMVDAQFNFIQNLIELERQVGSKLER